MEPTPLFKVVEWVNGTVTQGDPKTPVERVNTDSRTLQPGDCFVALPGDKFDGHDFLESVPGTGAVAAVISRMPVHPLPSSFGVVKVPGTLNALQDMGRAYRRSQKARVIAVTGSNGKTSTKEMIAAVLRQRFNTVATQGNLNNHIGVPLTLFQIGAKTEMAVVEMGMNHRGEIAALAGIALPEMAVITSIGSAHIEFLGSRKAIGEEKTDLLAALPPSGVAILNADEPILRELSKRAPGRVVWAGFAADAEWRATGIEMTSNGLDFDLHHGEREMRVRLPLFNRVMVSNALLAAAVGHEAGLSLREIVAGLESVRLVGQRMEVHPRGHGWVIDDCYNANPESMRGAIQALSEFPAPARRVAILGSMGELGEQAPQLHREVGAEAAVMAMNCHALLIFVGPHAADLEAGARQRGLSAENVIRCSTTEEAVWILPGLAQNNDTFLVKGSRFLKLEQVVAELRGKVSATAQAAH